MSFFQELCSIVALSLMQGLEKISLPHSLEDFSSIIDVRTPSEFAEDHLPQARNLPVLTNQQRIEVGTLYKRNPFSARILGARYISQNAAAHLATLEQDWNHEHQPLLYCWRGGLRSQSFAHILRSVGWRTRILEGGYKSFRKFVLTENERLLSAPLPKFIVLAGLTGVGKTRLLQHLAQENAQILDLEALANHRGSLLGGQGPQPSQRQFENRLYQSLSTFDNDRPVFTESESSKIGRINLPASLWKRLKQASVIEIEMPLEARGKLLKDDYAHFLDNPEGLKEQLSRLRQLRGHELVDRWSQQIEGQHWDDFLQSILKDHYDLCYRPAGAEGSNYQAAKATVRLASNRIEDLETAASRLLALSYD